MHTSGESMGGDQGAHPPPPPLSEGWDPPLHTDCHGVHLLLSLFKFIFFYLQPVPSHAIPPRYGPPPPPGMDCRMVELARKVTKCGVL